MGKVTRFFSGKGVRDVRVNKEGSFRTRGGGGGVGKRQPVNALRPSSWGGGGGGGIGLIYYHLMRGAAPPGQELPPLLLIRGQKGRGVRKENLSHPLKGRLGGLKGVER